MLFHVGQLEGETDPAFAPYLLYRDGTKVMLKYTTEVTDSCQLRVTGDDTFCVPLEEDTDVTSLTTKHSGCVRYERKVRVVTPWKPVGANPTFTPYLLYSDGKKVILKPEREISVTDSCELRVTGDDMCSVPLERGITVHFNSSDNMDFCGYKECDIYGFAFFSSTLSKYQIVIKPSPSDVKFVEGTRRLVTWRYV
jgi:hypothetical protein